MEKKVGTKTNFYGVDCVPIVGMNLNKKTIKKLVLDAKNK